MIAFLLALLLLAAPAPAAARPSDDGAPLAAGALPSAANPAAAAPAGAASPQDQAAATLAQDIATASYYELVTWCRQLGLDDAGSRHDLQQRLAGNLKVSLPAVAAAPKRTITVRSARESEYYTLKEADEKYVLLRGDVLIEVRDEKDGTLQSIKADSVTYNQTRGKVSAKGNVAYSLTRGGQTDTFTGQSLDFDMETSEAVFYDGSTTRVIKRAGTDVPYSFKGQTITRFANDTVIMSEGTFTSSPTPDDPLYRVRASAVWLLAPGEWAIKNFVLLVGRVPVLWLPGFFWPGDDFFFNPNFGTRTREGAFMQTTTYLFGRKPKEDSPFSFLQIADSTDAGYTLEPHGLFLRKVPGTSTTPPDTRNVKLLLDAYSHLGVFAGLTGDLSPLATFRTGIGFSRTIFPDNTPFWINPDGTIQSYWNSSSLFGLVVPFRLGLEGTFHTTGSVFSMNADFQFFSDPSFTSDFYNRSEANILSTLLSPPSTTTTTTTAQQSNLSWDVAGKLDLTKVVGLPFVQNLSIPSANVKVTWLSKDGPFLNPLSTSPTDPVDFDPGRTFYYPSSITAPDISFSMTGDLLSLSTVPTPTPAAQAQKTPALPAGSAVPAPGAPGTVAQKSSAPPAPGVASGAQTASPPPPATTPPATPAAPAATPASTPDPGKGLRAPHAAAAAKPPAPPAAARIPFREPTRQVDVAQGQSTGASSFKLSYQLQPRATFEHTFDTTNWVSKKAVDYSIRYHTLEVGGSGGVTAAASFLGNLADTSLGLSTDGLWRTRFDPSALELSSADWHSQLLQDMQQDRLALRSAFQGSLRPFQSFPALSASTLQYRLGVRLYQVSLTGTDPLNAVLTTATPDWTTNTITEHSLQSTLAWNTVQTTDALAVTLLLPPQTPSLTARLDVGAGPFKGTVQGGFSKPLSVLYQPLIVNGTLDFGSGYGGSEEVQLDVANAVIAKSTSQLNLGYFTGSFIAQETGPLNLLQPSTLRIGFENPGTPHWLWMDRIKYSLSVKTHWYLNLQNYLDNLFDFNLGITLSIFKFLDLTFSSVSTNSKTYRYFPSLAAAEGETWVNPINDLFASFDFFDTRTSALNDRVRSAFKIRTLAVTAVQHFPDWDLSFQYQGSPQLRRDPADNVLKNIWTPTFSIQVQWNAVSEVKSNVHGDYTGVYLR